MTIKVRCAFTISVEVPENWEPGHIQDEIELNSCPGTRLVGTALLEHMAAHERTGTCWACALSGENRIVEWPATLCTCPKVCDCQRPPVLVSEGCPIHNDTPQPDPDCRVHAR